MNVIAAHGHCTSNRTEIEGSESCGCFYCLAVFPSSEIEDWIGDRLGDTAICPHCGVDSVIGSASGVPLTREFLEAMHQHWF